ncbi:hypothetical protein Pan97_00520 [Bremerella volcania]|uniref:Carboxypeptidase regulatory-like domain-containing protein n=2 Tax=Bremerella volcania TaxID=2527984 RepID=A0A518C1I7_9BACT|nr:hypothetical protein Pan97_00520 [Bremerella volcania]
MIGCGESNAGGTVSGKVTLNGKPLTGANVKFHNPDLGVGITCELSPDGTFASTTKIPEATYQVAIIPPNTSHEPGADGMPVIPKLPKDLPQKYASPDTSDLTAEVHSQPVNEFTFEL